MTVASFHQYIINEGPFMLLTMKADMIHNGSCYIINEAESIL